MSARRDALRAALAAQTTAQGAAPLFPFSPSALSALAERARTRVLVGSDLDALANLADAAAVHGYPAPILERLGQAVGSSTSGARTTDPATSHVAAATRRPPTPRATNHLGRLLVAYRWARKLGPGAGMTSEEAAQVAGLPPESEYAKRCSELLALGLLEVAQDDDGHDRTRRGASGLQRLVFKLTPDGRRIADEIAP